MAISSDNILTVNKNVQRNLHSILSGIVIGDEFEPEHAGAGRDTTKEFSITVLTEIVWGSSGRGSARLKSMMGGAEQHGLIRIRKAGRRKFVSITEKGLSVYDELKTVYGE